MEWKEMPEQALFALKMLERAGYEAALVGGCVRDRIMGRAPGDYDITTSALPEETMRVFEKERIVPTGLRHGTVMLVHGGMPMEITTFREDGEYTDMRRPDSVRFTRSLKEDVLRRDFTMNALAWELGKGVIDHTGGVEDIRAGLIRAVGDPKRRFTEDALRILRAVRFGAQLGFDIEEDTDRALRALHGNIDRIAAERVRVEMEKTICGKFAADALENYMDVLRLRLVCGADISDEEWRNAAERLRAIGPEADGALCWASLLLPVGAQGAYEALGALRTDKATAQGVRDRITLAQGPLDSLYDLRCAVGEYGEKAARDAIDLKFSFDKAERERMLSLHGRIIAEKMPCTAAELAVGGKNLMAAGLRGRQIGIAMAALLDDVRAGRILNELGALLKRAEEFRNA